MGQDLPRRTGSTSSIESHSTDRDSPGTPTPNPHRFKGNSRPDISKTTTRQHAASESVKDNFRSLEKVQSTLHIAEADSSDGELSATSSDTEDAAGSNSDENQITKVYDEYDLKGFTPQDFDLLLTLAPADQLPAVTKSGVKADVASSLSGGQSAIRTPIKRYVIFHKFNRDPYASHTTSQRREFERNVYDYARAYGLGKQEALSEVRKARIIAGAPEDDSGDSSFGSEIDDTSKILSQLAKTTFSLRDIQAEGSNGIEDEPQMSKRVKQTRKRTRRRRKAGGEKRNTTATKNTGADAEHDRTRVPGKVNEKSARSQATEGPSSSSSIPATESQSSRRKRKRIDLEAGGDTTNQPPRGPKKSRHFQQTKKEQPTTAKSRPTLDSTAESMEVDVVHEKNADKRPTTPTLPRVTEKTIKRQEKLKRRREKASAESKEGIQSETNKPRMVKMPGVDVAQLPSEKAVDTEPSRFEYLPPAERQERKKRKGKHRDSESRVNVGVSSDKPVDQAGSKELGPNDPKSEQEAHQNFLRANMYDTQESTLTADKTPRELAEAERKQFKFVEKLDALKQFSNEKQLQLYDDGKYANANKQTKDDLKDLKEEKTTMEDMDTDTPKINQGRKNKEQKKTRRSKSKRDKVTKDEENGGDSNREIGNTKSSSTRSKRRKTGTEKQESLSHNEQVGFQ